MSKTSVHNYCPCINDAPRGLANQTPAKEKCEPSGLQTSSAVAACVQPLFGPHGKHLIFLKLTQK